MKKILLFTITTLIFLPSVTFAQKYLVNLTPAPNADFNTYINLLYKISISVAALLAVVKIIIAGAKYMLSDVVTNKSDAKKDIQGALLGLLLIAGAVIVLNTINPALSDGGLNIKKIVVPKLDITEQSVRPVAEKSNPDDNVAFDAAAEAAKKATPSGGCNTRTESTQGDFKITTLDVTGCPNDAGKTNIIGLFRIECEKQGGKFNPTADKPTCTLPKAGTVKSTGGGTATQQKSTITTPLTRVDAIAQSAELKSACEDKYGIATINNGPKGTFEGGSVTCKIPAIITYVSQSGVWYDEALFRADCKSLGGVYNNDWGASDHYCVVK